MSRGRSQTSFVSDTNKQKKGSKKEKKSKLTESQTHQIILKTLEKLKKSTKIFHLRWVPGEHIDADILTSTPIFWFAKFDWSIKDIETLFNAAHVPISVDMKDEIKAVYGTQRKSLKPRKSKRFSVLSKFKIDKDEKKEDKIDKTAQKYLRTKRLLKRVSKVNSSKVLVVNPQLKKRLTIQASKHSFAPNSMIKTTGNIKGLCPSLPKAPSFMSTLSEGKLVELSYDSDNDIPSDIDDEKGDVSDAEHITIREKHRRTSSMSVRKNTDYGAIAEKIWVKLAQTRGDKLNLAQFTIELYNCNILADPDIGTMIFNLIKLNPKVKTINSELFIDAGKKVNSIPLETEIVDINEENKPLIIFKQMLYHIKYKKPFNVSDFLTPKLKIEDLNDVSAVLSKLTSRDEDWRIRLQILEWISDKLEEDNHPLQDLAKNDKNLGNFLLGYMTQCLDERSGLAIPALEMFPNVFSITMTLNGDSFQYLNDIMTSLFLVLRNKRSKTLNQASDECIIQTIDVIMDWHQSGSLDNEVLFELCEIFRDNTIFKKMKHHRVRERCVAYFGYILYGLDYTDEQKDNNNNNNIPKSPRKLKKPKTKYNNKNKTEDSALPFVISKEMQRKYLLENKTFVNYCSKSLVNGTEDRNNEARQVTMKLLLKIDNTDKIILPHILMNNEPLTLKKYQKWRARNDKKSKKKNKRKPIRRNLIFKMKKNGSKK